MPLKKHPESTFSYAARSTLREPIPKLSIELVAMPRTLLGPFSKELTKSTETRKLNSAKYSLAARTLLPKATSE